TPPLVPPLPTAGAVDAPAVSQETDANALSPDPSRPSVPGDDIAPAAIEPPPPPPLTPEEEALLFPPSDRAPDQASEVADSPEPEPEPESAIAAAPEAVSILRPTPGLGGAVNGVTTDRLPRIGDAPAPEPEPVAAADNEMVPPLVRFARPFENPSGKPLFAIVLIDTGGPDLDRTALAALPFPVTFAIDPTAPDAATAAAIYREAGQEVIMLATGIPQGATAGDLEVTFQAHAAALPEAVAVIDLESAGFQNDRALASQVVPVIKGQGRGLLTWDKGLNAGDQVARRNGLASGLIFRRLDAEDEPATTQRRYLDRAAFKAAQEGRVTVVGKTRPKTVAALLEWTLEGRAASVALAPVSAVLAVP
ncbi:MAG: divergent polysaccharide deacetylase family protein, partial [Paracoccaceae bacterium]|nr:divergent polysaccharide deacetylase family protein [Paracoccaceae bacterium]